MIPPSQATPRDEQPLARFGKRVVSHLDAATASLSPPVALRLEQARRASLFRLRHDRKTAAVIVAAGGGAAVRAGPPAREPRWQRALAWLPVLAMIFGVWLIAEFQTRERARTAAVVDARLLTDVLPPAAYADPGFVEFLREGGTL